MAAATDIGDLPAIKCSNCGSNVEISAMGDHVCGNAAPESYSPPPPPPKSSFRTQPRGNGDMWSKYGRAEPPPRIDPLMANRPFLHPDDGNNDSLVPSPLSMSSGSRSPLRPLQRSRTSPLPSEPQSPDAFGENGIPKFPLPRSMSERRVGGMALKEAISAPPVPSPHYAHAMRQELDKPPRSAQFPPLSHQDLPSPTSPPPPPPLPKDDFSSSVPNVHKHSASIESRSSYGTSIVSSRYGDRSSKRSTALSSRRPSFGAGYKYEDEIPPIPQSPRNFLHQSTFSDSSYSDVSVKRQGQGEVHSGFDFSVGRSSFKAEIDKSGSSPLRVSSNTNSERLSSTRGSAELFFRSPSQSSYGAPIDLPDPSELRSVSPAGSTKVEYKAFKPLSSNYLQPNPPDHNDHDDMPRKNSDATSESALSVSHFARALGLDISDDHVEDSTMSSESSPSETRSGTSLSSLPSESSISRRKPSDQGRLGPVLEELRTETTSKSVLDESLHTESPISLEPPRIPGPLFSPDSPTDPTLDKKGSLSLIPEKTTIPNAEDPPPKQHILRSATEPANRPPPRPRGRCRGCGEMILGKSISSADGRLTGRYHRECFACCHCRAPFETSDFYVLNDRPYCAQHYHERNGTLCHTCHTGIEGQYLETNERLGPGPTDRQIFHPECLRCRTCQVDLKGEYFEWNGLVYCERDARRAAASMSPHRFRRPTMPSSPLAPPGPRGPPPPGYPGGRGRGRGFRPPPGSFDGPYGPPPQGGPPGPRRFPERRTTRLMMI